MSKYRKPGFTLLELLFAIIVLGVMMSVVMVTITGMLRFYTFSNYVRENQQNGRNVMDTMTREVRFGKLVLPDTNPSPVLCTADEKNNRLIRYELDAATHRLVRTEYSYSGKKLADVAACDGTGGVSTVSNQAVTPIKMYVKAFEVNRTGGATTTTDPKVAAVTLSMIYRSGNVNASTGDCDPGNIYCSPLNLNTAVNIRGKAE